MSEVCVTYIQQVFCVVNEETGEIERVVANDGLRLADHDPECVYDLDAVKDNRVPIHSDRAKKAIEISETEDWPAWDY